ncbi:MAG: hypothetical protein PHW73_00385 [Atribacterota bacterium]|nr:hypothetical protein [Atribacterota bacterium]
MGLIDMQELTGNSSMNDRTESLGAAGKKTSRLKMATTKAAQKLGAKKDLAKNEAAKSVSEKPVDKPVEESTKPSKKKILIISGIIIGVGVIGFFLYKKFKK